jgi:hypothetical protein
VSLHDWSTVGPHVSARPVTGLAFRDWGREARDPVSP